MITPLEPSIPRSLFRTPILLFLGTILLLGGMATPVKAQGARSEMERAYRGWQSAMATKNFALWEQYTASYRQALTYNVVVSRKDRWPDAMFNLPFRVPEITALTYLDTLENGKTANVIYFGRVDFGVMEGEIPENILMLCFVREDGSWKFDRTRFFNLSEEPAIRNQARVRDLGFLNNPQFQPEPEVPEAPKRVTRPDHVGEIWIAAVGYETQILIGGVHRSYVSNSIITDLVQGGLSEAGKDIQIKVRPTELPPGAKRRFEVEVWALRPQQKAVRVWAYKPDLEKELPEVHTGKVWANAVTMRGG